MILVCVDNEHRRRTLLVSGSFLFHPLPVSQSFPACVFYQIRQAY